MSSIVEVNNLSKSYLIAGDFLDVLKNISLKINRGEFLIIFGPSGSGKSTLLSILAGLDEPSMGEVLWNNINIYNLPEKERAYYRGSKIGIVFQQFNLISSLSAKDNIALPLLLAGSNRKESYRRTNFLLKAVDLGNRANHKPTQLSGGQQQRIAIGRALAANPEILLVDEPTGNLDIPTGNEIMDLLKDVNQKLGRTVVLVTHNPDFIKYADRVVYLEDGVIRKIDEKIEKNEKEPMNHSSDLSKKPKGLSFWETIRISTIHFVSKKLRTLLTTLGVALGVGSIVTLVSLGVGLQKITSDQLASLDALVSVGVQAKPDSILRLDDKTVEKISSITDVVLVSPTIILPSKVTLGSSTSQAMIYGIKPEATSFEGVGLIYGKNFSDNGIIITKALAKNFNNSNPEQLLGKKIQLNLVIMPTGDNFDLSKIKNFTVEEPVVGISGDDLATSVFAPLQKIKDLTGQEEYNSLKVKAFNRKKVEGVRNKIEEMGLKTSSVVDLINQVDKVFLITQIILGIIGGIALIVALIGIINIMTISLLERTHEVGIMKAIGASNLDIKKIFEYEVLLYGLIGGIAGVAGSWFFGQGINWLVNYLMQISNIPGSLNIFIIPPFFAIEMIILTTVVSMLAGLYPARRAARLSPMEALRYE